MDTQNYEVFVIGGGPAGSAAAILARGQNLRVCLAEKEGFPRFKIGESLLPHGNSLLKELGVWPAMEKAGFIQKFGAFFYVASGGGPREIIFSEGKIRGLDSTYQVERAKFDALLLEQARTSGAEIHLETTVRSVEPAAGGYRLTLSSAQGLREVFAQWVLDGSGRDNLFTCPPKKALDPSSSPKRLAIYSHFKGVVRAAGKAAGHTVVVRLPDGWFWLIPIDEERTSVGLVTTVEAMRQSRGTPEVIFRRAVAESPKLCELLGEAQPCMDFHVTSDYSYFRRDLAGDRLVLMGDAAGFFDPIFSSGVYMALYSSKLAVTAITRAHRSHRALSPREQKGYTRAIKNHAGVFQKLIRAFYDNDSFSIFMRPGAPLRVDRAVNSIVAGHASLTWPLWWRFQLFLFICWVQKRVQAIPPVNFYGMSRVAREEPAASTAPRSELSPPACPR